MDYTPGWLALHQAETAPAEGYEVDVSGFTDHLLTHQEVAPRKRRWTVTKLKRKQASLERQIAKEKAMLVEIAARRETCIELEAELEGLKARRTSTGTP